MIFIGVPLWLLFTKQRCIYGFGEITSSLPPCLALSLYTHQMFQAEDMRFFHRDKIMNCVRSFKIQS